MPCFSVPSVKDGNFPARWSSRPPAPPRVMARHPLRSLWSFSSGPLFSQDRLSNRFLLETSSPPRRAEQAQQALEGLSPVTWHSRGPPKPRGDRQGAPKAPLKLGNRQVAGVSAGGRGAAGRGLELHRSVWAIPWQAR